MNLHFMTAPLDFGFSVTQYFCDLSTTSVWQADDGNLSAQKPGDDMIGADEDLVARNFVALTDDANIYRLFVLLQNSTLRKGN